MRFVRLSCAIAVTVTLSGCQSPAHDMINNDFIGVTPEPVRQGMVGAWTGSIGPSLITMEWESAGTGRMCSSLSTAEAIQRVKFSGGEVFLQGGTRLDVESISDEFMIVRSPYFGGGDYKLYTDPDYSKATPYCADAFSR